MDSGSSSPEPVNSLPESSTAAAEDVDISYRSHTESPRPDSRHGESSRQSTEDTELDGPSQSDSKDMEIDHDTASSHGRREFRTTSDHGGSGPDMVSHVSADSDKIEDVTSPSSILQDDFCAPSTGYEYSNVRVGLTIATTAAY